MKKLAFTFLSILLATSAISAQNLAKNEAKALDSFLAQTSANGGTNAAALEHNGKGMIPGIKVENGHVT